MFFQPQRKYCLKEDQTNYKGFVANTSNLCEINWSTKYASKELFSNEQGQFGEADQLLFGAIPKPKILKKLALIIVIKGSAQFVQKVTF